MRVLVERWRLVWVFVGTMVTTVVAGLGMFVVLR